MEISMAANSSGMATDLQMKAPWCPYTAGVSCSFVTI